MAKFAENGATSLFKIKPSNKVYAIIVTVYWVSAISFNKRKLDRDMLVGFLR
jgi:hypothetical protein